MTLSACQSQHYLNRHKWCLQRKISYTLHVRVHHWILFDNSPNSVNIILQKKNSLKEKKYCCDNKLLTIKTYLTTNNVIGGGGGRARGYIHQLTTML